jgi:hypothetical protein
LRCNIGEPVPLLEQAVKKEMELEPWQATEHLFVTGKPGESLEIEFY